MAFGAQLGNDVINGRSCKEGIPAGTSDLDLIIIFWMDFLLHIFVFPYNRVDYKGMKPKLQAINPKS